MRDTENEVPIDVLIAGDFPGDGRPKPVAFPDPAGAAVQGEQTSHPSALNNIGPQTGQAAAAVGSAASVPSTSGGLGNGAFQAAIRLGMDANSTNMK